MGERLPTFVASIQIEFRGHVGTFWSDDDELSHADCSCSAGYRTTGTPQEVVDGWRAHMGPPVGPARCENHPDVVAVGAAVMPAPTAPYHRSVPACGPCLERLRAIGFVDVEVFGS